MINPEKLTFKKLIMTIGNLPSSYVESLSYYECLLWLCNYLENTVIPAVNNNAEAVSELQNLFTQLQTFVETYFDNLDVQEEVNTKLDEMALDGTLAEIINEEIFTELDNKVDTNTTNIETNTTNISSLNTELDKLVNKTSKLNLQNGVKVFAHRGASYEAPENTKPAFQWAVNQFFDGIETDVRNSSDGILYCFHDDTVDRMTDGTGYFNELTSAQIDDLNIDAGSNVDDYTDLKIPKFVEYLKFCKQTNVTPLIEIKFANEDSIINTFINDLKRYDVLYNCIIIGTNTDILEKIKLIDENIQLQALLSLTTGHIDYCASKGIDIDANYSFSLNSLYPLVQYAHEHNVRVGIWGVISPSRALVCRQSNVDYMTCESIYQSNKIDDSSTYATDNCFDYSCFNKLRIACKYEDYLINKGGLTYNPEFGLNTFLPRQATRHNGTNGYNDFNKTILGRWTSMQRIKIRQGTTVTYTPNPNYKFTFATYDTNGNFLPAYDWISNDSTTFTFVRENSQWAFLVVSNLSDTEMNHKDLEECSKIINSITY